MDISPINHSDIGLINQLNANYGAPPCNDESSSYIWVNYNISLTWIKAIWGWFPLLTMIPVRENSGVVIIYPDICKMLFHRNWAFSQWTWLWMIEWSVLCFTGYTTGAGLGQPASQTIFFSPAAKTSECSRNTAWNACLPQNVYPLVS